MIKSMTGYGKAIAELPKGKLTIEIRTLNGKTADVSIKSSLLPKDKELAARAMISSALQRGTIDVYLTWEAKECDVTVLSITVRMVLAVICGGIIGIEREYKRSPGGTFPRSARFCRRCGARSVIPRRAETPSGRRRKRSSPPERRRRSSAPRARGFSPPGRTAP